MSKSKTTKRFNVGDIFESFLCGEFEVIKYCNHKSVLVKFLNTGTELTTTAEQVLSGSIKDPMMKSVCGVGFIGIGNNKASDMNRKPYSVWRSMLHRCYMRSENYKAYWDCTVCDEWHNFQRFCDWFKGNYKDGFELDKDTLVSGNKVYGPSTCVFISKHENLSAKSKSITMMNGISGEIYRFNSLTDAARSTGVSVATISRLKSEEKARCTSSGWFILNFN